MSVFIFQKNEIVGNTVQIRDIYKSIVYGEQLSQIRNLIDTLNCLGHFLSTVILGEL